MLHHVLHYGFLPGLLDIEDLAFLDKNLIADLFVALERLGGKLPATSRALFTVLIVAVSPVKLIILIVSTRILIHGKERFLLSLLGQRVLLGLLLLMSLHSPSHISSACHWWRLPRICSLLHDRGLIVVARIKLCLGDSAYGRLMRVLMLLTS